MPLGIFAVVQTLFGGVERGLVAVAVLLLAFSTGLAAVFGATSYQRSRAGIAAAVVWGAAVAVVSLGLVAGGALAWQASGREFGRQSWFWLALGGATFALVGAVGTRRTAVPAVVLLLVLLLGVVLLGGS